MSHTIDYKRNIQELQRHQHLYISLLSESSKMSTISALPDDQTYLKPKRSTSSLKLLVAGAAVLAFMLGAVVATAASCLLKNVVVVEDREMEHRIPEGDIGPDFGKHGKHLCKGPSKDGNVCANAGTDREAYCTYALGPALYPEEFPVDLHFCAYCADDNLEL